MPPNRTLLPDWYKDPVIIWVSSNELPNWVEPDLYVIDALTTSVWNSSAVTIPPTVKSPLILPLPTTNKWPNEPVEVAEPLMFPVLNIFPATWSFCVGRFIPMPTFPPFCCKTKL